MIRQARGQGASRPGLAAALLAALLVWAPLPFGSAPPAFAAPLAAAALVALAVALAGRPLPVPRAAAAAAAALVAIAGLGLAQSLAWPAGVAERLAPFQATLARESAALLGAAPPAALPLSLAPGASRFAALVWLLPAAGLLLAARAGTTREGRRLVGAAIVLSGLLQVGLGAQLWLLRSDRIWGVVTPNAALRLRGTFVNPNHLALALEIALAVTAAWLWWGARRALGEPRAERRLLAAGPPALVFLVLFAGLGFTGSRAGWLAALAGVLVALAVAASGRSRRWTLAAGAAGLALVLGWAAFQGGGGAAERWLGTSAGDASLGARIEASRRALELWQRTPLIGVGLGAFRAAFPLVQGDDDLLAGVWRHAHDDWAELVATTGLAGTALAGLGLGALLAGLVRARRAAVRSEERAAVAAAAGALAAAALHSLVDFGLTMPANALALASVAGMGAAVARIPRTGIESLDGEDPEGARAAQPPEETTVQPSVAPPSKPSANSG